MKNFLTKNPLVWPFVILSVAGIDVYSANLWPRYLFYLVPAFVIFLILLRNIIVGYQYKTKLDPLWFPALFLALASGEFFDAGLTSHFVLYLVPSLVLLCIMVVKGFKETKSTKTAR